MSSDSAVEELLSVEGIMVASHPGQIRLVIDQVVVDLDENDIVSASELPSPTDLEGRIAQPVRLELRRGARLLGAGAAAAYEDVLWKQGHLFAMRTRRGEQPWRITESYRQLERSFFARYGIVAAGEAETMP
jgi:hypothetical protein